MLGRTATGNDATPGQVGAAIVVAIAVHAAAFVVSGSGIVRPHPAAETDRSYGVPVALMPVVDESPGLLKLGGGTPGGLPEAWRVRAPTRRAAPAKSPSEPAPTPGPADASRPVDAPDSVHAPGSGETGPDTLAPDGPTTPGAAGSGDIPGPGGEGSPFGSPDGTVVDPLKGRAVSLYRARITSWLSRRFRVSGSGMSTEELLKYRVGASIRVGANRTVTGYDITPSGNAVFDSAARSALDSVVGQQLPAPPDHYPAADVQSQISVTFVCSERSCD